jgi:hypothetical protein
VPIQKTVTLLNNFVATTSSFFNAFSETVEKRISNVSNKITELETLLAVLEAKLNSVPDLETIAVPPVAAAEPVAAAAPSSSSAAPAAAPAPAAAVEVAPVPAPAAAVEAPATDSNLVKACEHPDYLPFFKLLKVGVPPFVVQAKVAAAGLDGSMIDTPDKLISK